MLFIMVKSIWSEISFYYWNSETFTSQIHCRGGKISRQGAIRGYDEEIDTRLRE